MPIADFRMTEKVMCAGIPITTFLSEDRNFIFVSVTDLVEQLCLHLEPEGYEIHPFTLYDNLNRGTEHLCINLEEVARLLREAETKPEYQDDLDDFRDKFFHEVMTFWNRFEPAAASLGIKEALAVVDTRMTYFSEKLGLPAGPVLEYIYECLGYDQIPSVAELTAEEHGFMTVAKMNLVSHISESIDIGVQPYEALRRATEEMGPGLREFGNAVRGLATV